MAMEFVISLRDETNAGNAASGNTPAHGVELTAAELAQLKKQFGADLARQILQQGTVGGQPVRIPEAKDSALATIEKQIVPALAANAPAVATLLRAAPKEAAMEKAEEELLPELQREAETVLETTGETIPPVIEEARSRPAKAKAPEVLEAEAADPAMQAARNRLQKVRAQVAEERAYAELTGNEEPVYDAIDPALEARRKELQPINDTLKSGSRVAAQMGMGATGQALFGTADVVMGLATGDPIQAAIGGIQLVGAASTAVANVLDAARSAIEFYAGQVRDMAHNDYWKLLDDRFTAVSDVLGKIPVVGDAVAASFNLAVAPVRAFHDVVESFVQRGKELAGFNPALASANAMADVRTLLADLHEADVLGPDLARLTNSFTDLSMEMRELFLPVKEWIVEKLADIMEVVVEVTRDVKGYTAETVEVLKTMLELLNDIFGSGHIADIPALLQGLPQRMSDAFDQSQRRRERGRQDERLIERLYGLNAPAAEEGADQVRMARGAQPRFAPPILAGM